MRLAYTFSADRYARSVGSLLLVRPHVIGEQAIAFDRKPRTVPIDLTATGHWHDSFTIKLPSGYTVEDLPEPVHAEMDFATYQSTCTVKDNTLHYERDYVVRQINLPPSRAQDVARLEAIINADEHANAVLKKP